jgi:2-aminoadipate transaminase
MVQPICDRKGSEDFGSANFNQHLLATVMQKGLYAPHVSQLRDSYRIKRDAMVASAEDYFSDIPGVSWVVPQGGLYVWMTLPDTIETGFDSPLFQQATQVEKMMYVPGEICQAGPEASRPKNEMRLSFGVQDVAGIQTGMQRLANAVHAILKK